MSYIDVFAKWWLGIKEPEITEIKLSDPNGVIDHRRRCSVCRQLVGTYRRYANGVDICIPCDTKAV